MKFGVSLAVDDGQTRLALEEICTLLTEDTGLAIDPLYAGAPDALGEALATGEVQFAWLSPTLLLIDPRLSHLVPMLASSRDGVTIFHSVAFCRADSKIRTLDDLRGVSAAWVAPTSASGFLVPRLALAREGVDFEIAFLVETFLKSHGAVAQAVFAGEAHVGATFAHFEGGDSSRKLLHAGFHDAPNRAEARILATGGPIPSDMIVAHPDVPIMDRIAICGALCRLPQCAVGGPALRHVIGADDFSPVSPHALEELKTLMEAAEEIAP